MRQKILVSVLVLCTLISACEPDVSIELQAQTPNLQVNATITSIEFDFDDGKAIYRALATITNTTEKPQDYSNMWLWLESGKSLSARAYLHSLASHQIDTSPIELGPKESLNLELYWVFPSRELEQPSDDAFVLVLRPETESYADDDPRLAVIYYYGFEIERITGIHEEEIEELGCTYSADSDSIERALTKLNLKNVNYDRRDVRAKIAMHGESFFVDRDGIVRKGDNYFQLDKARFVASITLVDSCE